jgi:ABC-type branched-subunit amino acid transport system ATPase component/branched-subunit amino acid ABC-type transport system permease component
MDEVLRFGLLGLGVGAIYALVAQGIVLIYKGSGVLNFAQGAMGMIGAEIFYTLVDEKDVEWKFALVLGIGVPALIGAATHLGIMRWMRTANALSRLIVTLGLLAGIQAVGLQVWGGETKLASALLPQNIVEPLRDTPIGVDRLWLLVIAVGLTIALAVVYRFTRFGLATSAVAENQTATSSLGISPDVIATVNWSLGGALAGAAAILIAPIIGLSVTTLSLLVIAGLAAALVGGFSSFTLTLVGGLAIGVLESEMAGGFRDIPVLNYFSDDPGWSKSVPFLVIIAMLLIRGRALPLRHEIAEKPPELGDGKLKPKTIIIGTILMIAFIWVTNVSWVDAITTTVVIALVCLSLVVVTGFAGQLSLAQFALAGIGAWVAGRLVDNYSIPFELAILAGIAGAIPVGLVVALPALRTRGINLAVATLGLALILERLILLNPNRTGKFEGTTVGEPTFFGINLGSVVHPERYATFCVLLFVVASIVVANLRRGRAGRRLIAVRTNERAAAALGISVFGAKLYAFGLAAAIAALAGVLSAFRRPIVVFDSFSVFASINAVVYAVIGGIGYVIGPLLGSELAPGTVGPKIFDVLFGWTGIDVDTIFEVAGGFLLITILIQNANGLAPQTIKQMKWYARMLRLQRPTPTPEPLPDVAREPVKQATLAVEDLAVRFGGVVALNGVSLTVRPGQVLGLIGPNGAGKTTLIDAVTGFVRPSGGRVTFDGRSLAGLNARRRARLGIGRSFQSLELFEDMTVRDNLRSGSDRRDPWAYVTDLCWPGNPPLSSTAVAAVREFGLEADLDRKPGELPYGRRRLVGIARAIATQPSVLMLDEPAAGLDDGETAELGDLIRRLAEQWGLAILLVEHDVGMVLRVCDHIVALDFGRQIADGTPHEIRRDAAVVAAYLGEEDDAGVATSVSETI